MWCCTGLASSKLTFLSRLGATRGAPHRQRLFVSDFHGYRIHVQLGTRCSIVTSESRHAYTLDRGVSHFATDAGCFVFLTNERYASQLLRLVEEQPNRLSSLNSHLCDAYASQSAQ